MIRPTYASRFQCDGNALVLPPNEDEIAVNVSMISNRKLSKEIA